MAELILTARRWKEKGAYAALRTWKNFVFKIKQNGKKSDNNLTLYSDRLTKQKVSSKHICSGERKFAIKYRGKKQRNMFNQRTVGQVSLCNPEALSWVQLKETSSCLVESKTVKLSSPTHTHVRQPNRYSQRVSILWLLCNSLRAELMSVARTFFSLVGLKISQKRWGSLWLFVGLQLM